MKTNVGLVDRLVRVAGAVALGVASVVLGFNSWWWLLIPAAILLATAAVGFCGLYTLLGISTCPHKVSSK